MTDSFSKAFDYIAMSSKEIKIGICETCGNDVQPSTIPHPITGEPRTIVVDCGCNWKRRQAEIKASEEYARKKEIETLFSISNIGARLAHMTFLDLEVNSGNEECIKACRRYVDRFETYAERSLFLFGKAGNGKSTLAAATMNELKKQGKSVVFQSVPELLTKIRNTFNSQKESEKNIMWALMNCDLLILDDIGTERITDWVNQKLFEIIDGRYRQRRPIFYTSNHKPSDLRDMFDEHRKIIDRIIETTYPFENKSSSFRLQGALNRMKQGEFWNE